MACKKLIAVVLLCYVMEIGAQRISSPRLLTRLNGKSGKLTQHGRLSLEQIQGRLGHPESPKQHNIKNGSRLHGIVSTLNRRPIRFGAETESRSDPQGRAFDNAANCGKSKVSSRIVGGSTVTKGEWPWQAAILRFLDLTGEWYFECGGTLIQSQWVLSAAQCFILRSPTNTLVSLGGLSQDQSDSSTRILAVGEIKCHSLFLASGIEYDICLVKLAKPVSFSTYILPACMPSPSETASVGEQCVMTGWGDREGGLTSSTLREATAVIQERSQCLQKYNYIPTDHFCAGQDNTALSPCDGDGGGPLVCPTTKNGAESFTVKGIISAGATDCGEISKNPGVFTDVTRYTTWVDSTMSSAKDTSQCFDATTIRPCGSIITESGTIIRSPVQDTDSWLYPRNKICSWDVVAPSNSKVKIEFICPFSMEATTSTIDSCNDDHVTVQEPSGAGVRYCGNFITSESYTASGNKVTVTFRSDSDTKIAQGFVVRASWNGAESFRCSLVVLLLSCIVLLLNW